MTEFTPVAGILGGLLIGAAAVILMAGAGRVMGASGIFAGLLTLKPVGETAWRAVFIAGMLAGAGLAALTGWFDPASLLFANPWTLVVAGLLVGFGTRMGSGCTSGHGICGLSRLSPRSLVATLTFMIVAIVTTYVVRHVVGS